MRKEQYLLEKQDIPLISLDIPAWISTIRGIRARKGKAGTCQETTNKRTTENERDFGQTRIRTNNNNLKKQN